jgi:hypothetical protein
MVRQLARSARSGNSTGQIVDLKADVRAKEEFVKALEDGRVARL